MMFTMAWRSVVTERDRRLSNRKPPKEVRVDDVLLDITHTPLLARAGLPVDLLGHLPGGLGPELCSKLLGVLRFEPVDDEQARLEHGLVEVGVLREHLRCEEERHLCLSGLQQEVDDLPCFLESSELVDGDKHGLDGVASSNETKSP